MGRRSDDDSADNGERDEVGRQRQAKVGESLRELRGQDDGSSEGDWSHADSTFGANQVNGVPPGIGNPPLSAPASMH